MGWLKLNFTCYLTGGLECAVRATSSRSIIAEQFIENDGGDLYDYKLCCFDGEPKVIICILMDRYADADERIVLFWTPTGTVLPFNINVHPARAAG